MTPHGLFSDAEKSLFIQQLSTTSCYLEWGMGNSTLWALTSPVRKIVAVEGHAPFLSDWVHAQPSITDAEKKKRLRITHADTGNTGPYTEPDPALTVKGMAYAMPKTRVTPDFALVDGRFRVACALTAALMGVKRVAVHDFSNREHYQPMLEFFQVVGTADSLVILKPKPRINVKTLTARRAEFFKDPR